MAFRDPTDKYAKMTLTIIIGILILMLLGIAYLVPAYGIAATDPGKPGYDSVLSQLLAAVTGRGAFYWLSIGSILVVLSLSANTAFADFPRLARAIAQNGYLPHAFVIRGRRLVFAQGVSALALLTGLLLIIFRGVTDRVPGVHAFSGRHGDALEAGWRTWRSAEHVPEWLGRRGNRDYYGCGFGSQVYGGCVDHRAVGAKPDSDDARGQTPLLTGSTGNLHAYARSYR
jgi:hypothetical protein